MDISMIVSVLAALFIGGLELIILWRIATNEIDLKYLISESNGHASLSRFQMLIFTFVIAGGVLYLVVRNGGNFPSIDSSVAALLGISGGTYVLAKGVQVRAENDANTKKQSQVTTPPQPQNPA